MAEQLYFCVKCKDKREMKNPQEVTMKNGKPAKKGQCAICGTTIFAIVGAKKAYCNVKMCGREFRKFMP